MEQLQQNIFKLSLEDQDFELGFAEWRDQWYEDASIEAYFRKHDTCFNDQDFWGEYFNLVKSGLHRLIDAYTYLLSFLAF